LLTLATRIGGFLDLQVNLARGVVDQNRLHLDHGGRGIGALRRPRRQQRSGQIGVEDPARPREFKLRAALANNAQTAKVIAPSREAGNA